MPSLKPLVVFFAVLTVCYCDSTKKKHKYDLYWHGLHYLTFLALKVKFFLAVGFFFTIGLVVGKFFAILKLVEYMKGKSNDNHHSEKIVYAAPPSVSSGYSPVHSFPQPGPDFGKSHGYGGGGSYQESYPPGFAVDQPPPGAEISGGGHSSGPEGNYGQGSPYGYGRSDSLGNYTVSGYLKLFQNMLRKFNITNRAFNDLNLKSEACRRKFVCEADFSSEKNEILKLAFDLFSDDNYVRYKTRRNVTSLEECSNLYADCLEDT